MCLRTHKISINMLQPQFQHLVSFWWRFNSIYLILFPGMSMCQYTNNLFQSYLLSSSYKWYYRSPSPLVICNQKKQATPLSGGFLLGALFRCFRGGPGKSSLHKYASSSQSPGTFGATLEGGLRGSPQELRVVFRENRVPPKSIFDIFVLGVGGLQGWKVQANICFFLKLVWSGQFWILICPDL